MLPRTSHPDPLRVIMIAMARNERPMECARCHSEIPTDRRSKYCSDRCRNHVAWKTYRESEKGKAKSRANCANYYRKHRKDTPEYRAYRKSLRQRNSLD